MSRRVLRPEAQLPISESATQRQDPVNRVVSYDFSSGTIR